MSTLFPFKNTLKIAVVNDIHVGKCIEHNGKIRASSRLVEDMLPGFLREIIQQHSPDALINLDDLIRSEERDFDLQKYRRLIANFDQKKSSVIHLLGNHELKEMRLG
jgi:metallophosphoesterase superfamily enzyme